MLDDLSLRDLFYQALLLHRMKYTVDNSAIEEAIKVIHAGYKPKPWKDCPTAHPVDYSDPAFQCAYLHKYASFHAALVRKVLLMMLDADESMLRNSFLGHGPFRICCLGGGPGTDVVGLLSVFCDMHEFLNRSLQFTVVDCMIQWVYALLSVATVSKSAQFEFLGTFLSNCSYYQADMLSHIPESVIEVITSAEMVTMVKFVSAAASEMTLSMLKVVFSSLKPGALVLFIDNAAGGFHEIVCEAAYTCGLFTVSGPFRHMNYQNEVFKRKMFGFFSLSSTTVAAQMWRKNPIASLNSLLMTCYENPSANPTRASERKKRKRKRSTQKYASSSSEAHCFISPTTGNTNHGQNQSCFNSEQKDLLASSVDCNTQCISPMKLPRTGDPVSEMSKPSNLKSDAGQSFARAFGSSSSRHQNEPDVVQGLLKEKASCTCSLKLPSKDDLVADVYESSSCHSDCEEDMPLLKGEVWCTSSLKFLQKSVLATDLRESSYDKSKHLNMKSSLEESFERVFDSSWRRDYPENFRSPVASLLQPNGSEAPTSPSLEERSLGATVDLSKEINESSCEKGNNNNSLKSCPRNFPFAVISPSKTVSPKARCEGNDICTLAPPASDYAPVLEGPEAHAVDSRSSDHVVAEEEVVVEEEGSSCVCCIIL